MDLLQAFNELIARLNAYVNDLSESDRDSLFQLVAGASRPELDEMFEQARQNRNDSMVNFVKAAKLIQTIGLEPVR